MVEQKERHESIGYAMATGIRIRPSVATSPRIHFFHYLVLSSYVTARAIMTSFRLSEIMLQEASEYMWIMSDQILTSTVPIIGERMKRGVEFRFIFPETIVPPPGVKPEPGAKRRRLPKVEEIILMTEKEAMFCFPDLSGKMDYALLTAKDPSSHKWCKDLFLHRWEKAIPAPVPLQAPSTTK